MKKSLLLILGINFLPVMYAFSLVDMDWLQESIKKHAHQGDLVLYINSKKVENFGFDDCKFFRNGESLIVKSFIKKNDIVFDAGAHIGGWTQAVLDATKSQCTIYAFEPVPDTYKFLEKKQVRNKVFCYNVALGKEEAELELNYFFERGSDCSSLFNRPILQDVPVRKIKVPVLYLDKFASEHGVRHINFLKIDTEGAEYDVLMGAKNLIESNSIDIIQFEYGGTYRDAQITLFQVYTYLRSHKYLIFRIVPNGLIYIPEWDVMLENFLYANYLALKEL